MVPMRVRSSDVDAHRKPRGAFLFAALLLLLSVWGLRAQVAANNQSQTTNNEPKSNRVLELDGKGSYVELPPNIFNDLDEATVEAWVRWDDFSGQAKRVFDYGNGLRDLSVATWWGSPDLWFAKRDPQSRVLHSIHVPGILRAQQWFHVAAVSGRDGMRLYLNGTLVGTNDHAGSFSSLGNGDHCYLGQTVTTNDPPTNFKGAIDEVRVWKVARTGEQIRQRMFESLTGTESGLVGLWNFVDPANPGNDASPAGNHGDTRGQARVVETALPAESSLPHWSRLSFKFTDPIGAPVSGVTVRALTNADEVATSTSSDAAGRCALTVWEATPNVDLKATGPNDAGGWRFQVSLTPGTERPVEWQLTLANHIAGTLMALDGKTLLDNVVVELVQADPGGSGHREEDLTSKSETRIPNSEIDPRLLSLAPTNRVLSLPREGSYAALPPNIFSNLTQATVEGWVKCKSSDDMDFFFHFGASERGIWVARSKNDVVAVIGSSPDNSPSIRLTNVLTTNHWYHLALVSGPGGMRLFLNGVLVGTNASERSFAALGLNEGNDLGRSGDRREGHQTADDDMLGPKPFTNWRSFGE